MEDLFRFVKEEKEEVLYKFTSTADELRSQGMRGFLLPGTFSGLFLCVCAALFINFTENALATAVLRGVGALGGVIIASSLLLYAMFMRQSRRAKESSLYITDKNVIWCEGGRYAKMPLSEITDARVEKAERLAAIPFDMSALEGKLLVLFYRGADMKIPYIADCERAAEIIKSLC